MRRRMIDEGIDLALFLTSRRIVCLENPDVNKLMCCGVAMMLVCGGCRMKSRGNAGVLDPYPRADYPTAAAPATETRLPAPAIDFASTPEPVAAPQMAEVPATRTHVVQSRDTLYSLARQYYNDPKQWTRIQAANPGLVPERMPIGKSIVIP
jgi:LysM repeat protein